MRIGKTTYKSLSFKETFVNKLISGEKNQTFRIIYIPDYVIDEIIAIVFKKQKKEDESEEKSENKKDKNKDVKFLYLAKVKEIYPKKICDVTLEEAKKDGFDSIEDFQNGIFEINNMKKNEKTLQHWGFFTIFNRMTDIYDYIPMEDIQIDLESEDQ